MVDPGGQWPGVCCSDAQDWIAAVGAQTACIEPVSPWEYATSLSGNSVRLGDEREGFISYICNADLGLCIARASSNRKLHSRKWRRPAVTGSGPSTLQKGERGGWSAMRFN